MGAGAGVGMVGMEVGWVKVRVGWAGVGLGWAVVGVDWAGREGGTDKQLIRFCSWFPERRTGRWCCLCPVGRSREDRRSTHWSRQ